jgi:hypothetical protein
MDERGHSGTLERECNYDQNSGRAGLADKGHGCTMLKRRPGLLFFGCRYEYEMRQEQEVCLNLSDAT